ncbi:hypothetical protein SAMN05519105_0727 [Rhodobacter sp. 24-YEA-8]|nr:hypothetical protein SAMN05519105_0727 [Rhodobacter sp. 24-YEA-8]
MSGKTKTHHGSFDVANNILDRGIQADWPHQKSQAGFNCSCGANYWHCVPVLPDPLSGKCPFSYCHEIVGRSLRANAVPLWPGMC